MQTQGFQYPPNIWVQSKMVRQLRPVFKCLYASSFVLPFIYSFFFLYDCHSKLLPHKDMKTTIEIENKSYMYLWQNIYEYRISPRTLPMCCRMLCTLLFTSVTSCAACSLYTFCSSMYRLESAVMSGMVPLTGNAPIYTNDTQNL